MRHVISSSFFEVIEEGSEAEPKHDSGYFNYPKEKVDVSGNDSINEIRKKMIIKRLTPSFLEIIRQRQFRVLFIIYPEIFYHLRHLLPFVYLIYAVKVKGVGFALGLLNELLKWAAKKFFEKFGLEETITQNH